MITADANGATPIDPDEAAGLIPTHVATMADLNEWEQANIVQAERWAFARRRRDVLSVPYIRRLHFRMFESTWRWAGKFRTSEKTIGIAYWQIAEALVNLCKDAEYWLDREVYSNDEAATRFHHRLTQIHPFPNGNGRHARLMTDVLLVANGRPRFDWGSSDLHAVGSSRESYVSALRAADEQDIGPMKEFLQLQARSETTESTRD